MLSKQEAIQCLKDLMQDGATVHTVIRSVARSGMSRCMDVLYFKTEADGTISKRYLTGWCVSLGLGHQSMSMWQRSEGMRVSGCGMDMGFHVVDSLQRILGYSKLRQEWI